MNDGAGESPRPDLHPLPRFSRDRSQARVCSRPAPIPPGAQPLPSPPVAARLESANAAVRLSMALGRRAISARAARLFMSLGRLLDVVITRAPALFIRHVEGEGETEFLKFPSLGRPHEVIVIDAPDPDRLAVGLGERDQNVPIALGLVAVNFDDRIGDPMERQRDVLSSFEVVADT